MIYNSEGKRRRRGLLQESLRGGSSPRRSLALSEFRLRRNAKRAALACSEILTQMDPTGDTQLVYAIRLMLAGEHERALPVRRGSVPEASARTWLKSGTSSELLSPAARGSHASARHGRPSSTPRTLLGGGGPRVPAGPGDGKGRGLRPDRGDDLTVRDVGERDLERGSTHLRRSTTRTRRREAQKSWRRRTKRRRAAREEEEGRRGVDRRHGAARKPKTFSWTFVHFAAGSGVTPWPLPGVVFPSLGVVLAAAGARPAPRKSSVREGSRRFPSSRRAADPGSDSGARSTHDAAQSVRPERASGPLGGRPRGRAGFRRTTFCEPPRPPFDASLRPDSILVLQRGATTATGAAAGARCRARALRAGSGSRCGPSAMWIARPPARTRRAQSRSRGRGALAALFGAPQVRIRDGRRAAVAPRRGPPHLRRRRGPRATPPGRRPSPRGRRRASSACGRRA